MINRQQKLSDSNSLFLFGARGTGKSTLLRQLFPEDPDTLWIDLLSYEDEERFVRTPGELARVIDGSSFRRIIIDEVQKSPKLLDIVHKTLVERDQQGLQPIQFILSGSSARKLKRGGANLLAGRAFTYHLFPFTYRELGDEFDLGLALRFGTLPQISKYTIESDKSDYLTSYVRTYLKEEIQVEQLVRNLNPFRDFLEIAAQANGEIINYSNFSKQIGVDDKTVSNYFQILEDTLLGFFVPSFHRSIRKRQIESPKFFLFDTGVKNALERSLGLDMQEKSYAYGKAFEHFIISEIFRLNEYLRKDFRISYLKTKDGAEIDLVLDRPGEKDLLIEIKSTNQAQADHVSRLKHFQKTWDRECESLLISRDELQKNIEGVLCLFWDEALNKIFDF